jgi:hypothetical protein
MDQRLYTHWKVIISNSKFFGYYQKIFFILKFLFKRQVTFIYPEFSLLIQKFQIIFYKQFLI